MAGASTRVVVVTGATRGIGRETALAFARRGDAVVLVGRSTQDAPHRLLPGSLEDVEELVRAAGAADVLSIAADVSDPAAVERLAAATTERFGRCDVLVNNAAYSTDFGPALSIPIARWNTAWRVNVLGPLQLMQAFVPAMIAAGGGSVVNISSGSVSHYLAGQLPYGVTKMAIERITDDLAVELRGDGIALNVVRIDEGVPTEAYLLVSGAIGATTVGRPLTSPAELGDAIAWVADQPVATSGHLYTLGELRALGALPEPSTVLPSASGEGT